jgi:hypothetical protein
VTTTPIVPPRQEKSTDSTGNGSKVKGLINELAP